MLKTHPLNLYNSNKAVVNVNKIRDLRQNAGMKQSDLAKILNCAPTAVSKYELGQLDLSSATIGRLCDVFGCTADYLLGRSELPTPEISDEEARLLQAFRRADDHSRGIVTYTLAPFSQDTSSETA